MIINHTHRTIFFHVPKAAGTSVRLAIKGSSKEDNVKDLWGFGEDRYAPYSVSDYAHLTSSYLNDYLGRLPDLHQYEAASLVREVESRFVSAYAECATRDPYPLIGTLSENLVSALSQSFSNPAYIHLRPTHHFWPARNILTQLSRFHELDYDTLGTQGSFAVRTLSRMFGGSFVENLSPTRLFTDDEEKVKLVRDTRRLLHGEPTLDQDWVLFNLYTFYSSEVRPIHWKAGFERFLDSLANHAPRLESLQLRLTLYNHPDCRSYFEMHASRRDQLRSVLTSLRSLVPFEGALSENVGVTL